MIIVNLFTCVVSSQYINTKSLNPVIIYLTGNMRNEFIATKRNYILTKVGRYFCLPTLITDQSISYKHI